MPRAVVVTLLAVLTVADPSGAQDTKRLADALVRSLRARQNEDGTYGTGLVDTCRVLDAFARSPRRYTDLDGPFFRRAAEAVAADDEPARDAWRVLALASCLAPRLAEARETSLARLSSRREAPLERPTAFALATFAPQELDGREAGDDPVLAMLLADDPEAPDEPAVDDPVAWSQWARAARLCDRVPVGRPPLPDPAPDASLDRLVSDLNRVIVQHGLPADPRGWGTEAAEEPRPEVVASPRTLEEALAEALGWWQSRQDGGTFGLGMPGWTGPEPGVTALCLSAAMGASERLGQPRPAWVDAGLDLLTDLQREDGSIHLYGVAVYTTSVALEALLAGGRPQDAGAVARALEFLVAAQADEGEGYLPHEDPHYGGIGYGGDERPDLSNTQMAIEAAARAGLEADADFFRKALLFLERNQNLGEVVQRSWPRPGGGRLVSGTDGGATYMPGNSPAGEDRVADGVWTARSYGSMTYALTKSYLLCGLPLDDARVSAAVDWLVEHFTLETNPGFRDPMKAADGLYYYYLAMARTLRRLPNERLVTDEGPLRWRERLTGRLLARQRVDGSWINEDSARWYEGSAPLCTAYAVLALLAAGDTTGGSGG